MLSAQNKGVSGWARSIWIRVGAVGTIALVVVGSLVLTSKVKSASAISEKWLSVDSKIELIPSEDLNHNGVADGGDGVKFTYSISNPTDGSYQFATLKTGLDSSSLNYIHDMVGITGVDTQKQTINIPNIHLGSGQSLTISFEAVANFDTQDKDLVTTPELFAKNGTSLVKSRTTKMHVKAASPDPNRYTVKVKVKGNE